MNKQTKGGDKSICDVVCKCPIQNFFSFSVLANTQPLKKQPKKKPKNHKKKERFLEARKKNRQRERERERERKREEHRRADATEKERGEMIKLVAAKVPRLFSSLVLVFVFSTFFSSSG